MQKEINFDYFEHEKIDNKFIYELTLSDYLDIMYKKLPEHKKEIWGNINFLGEPKQKYSDRHESCIANAIWTNEKIPIQVLKDYPDLEKELLRAV